MSMTLLYITTTVLYCIVLYSIKYVPQPNETKSFPFVLSLTPIEPMYVLLPIPFLSLTHAVTNVIYSVKYKHHKGYW